MCSLNIHGFPLQWSNSKNPGKNAGENAKYIVFRGETTGQVHLNSFRAIKFNCVFSFGWWINWWGFWAYSFPAPVLQRTFVRGRGHFMFPLRLRAQPRHFFTYCWPTNSGQPIRMVQTWTNSWCLSYHVVGKMLFINCTLVLFVLTWKMTSFPIHIHCLGNRTWSINLYHHPRLAPIFALSPPARLFRTAPAAPRSQQAPWRLSPCISPGLHRRILSNLKCPCTFEGARS